MQRSRDDGITTSGISQRMFVYRRDAQLIFAETHSSPKQVACPDLAANSAG